MYTKSTSITSINDSADQIINSGTETTIDDRHDNSNFKNIALAGFILPILLFPTSLTQAKNFTTDTFIEDSLLVKSPNTYDSSKYDFISGKGLEDEDLTYPDLFF